MLSLLVVAGTLVEVTDDRFVFDIAYATEQNFTGQRLYTRAVCLLLPEAAAMLRRAQDLLDQAAAGTKLLLKDCYRPHHVQKQLWDLVKDTPKRAYVSDPTRGGSVHSYGAAVDVSLWRAGAALDMGTAYDHLGPLAEPRLEARYQQSGELTQAQVEARQLLRRVMTEAGFRFIRNEWWHFDGFWGKALRSRFQRLDEPL